MAEWTIYSSNGTAKASVKELELHDEWMAECFITVSVKSAEPIDFAVGDYIDYRNERYSINYDPSKIKKARRNTYGEGFVYDNIKFVAVQDELVRCDFCDIVLSDNQMHYTQLPTFPFYCETVDDLLDRIQANMEELYPGQWIIISPDLNRDSQRGLCVGREQAFINAYNKYIGGGEFTYEKTGVALTVDNINCWEALAKAHNDFLLDFIIRGRTVIVGTAGVFTSNKFRYGKGNGLYEIEVVGDSEQKVVTRLRAYGSEKNLPERYYAERNLRVFSTVTEIDEKYDDAISFYTDLRFSAKYFTYRSQSYPGTSDHPNYIVGMEANGISIIGYVSVAYNNDNFYFYCEWTGSGEDDRDEPDRSAMRAFKDALEVGDKVYFTAYVEKGAFDSAHQESSETSLPDNMAVNKLMLPGFPDVSLREWVRENRPELIEEGFEFSTNSVRPYIDSPNKERYGIRPSNIFFDGTGDTDDIHPTIEGMTWDGHPCDEVVEAQQIEDNGVLSENSKEDDKRVTITIPYAGFKLNEEWKDGATISMKDGMCGARDFKILKKPTQDDNGNWICVCERAYDSVLKMYFPYSDFQIHTGDKFVLTGIDLPDSYIEAASVRLFDAAMDALRKNHLPRVTYQPKIDHIWMARQHDTAMASGGVVKSLHDTLKAGDYFSFADSDLGIDTDIIIDILTIKENGDNGIPTYEITLRDEKQVSTFEKRLEKIASSASSGSAGGNINTRQIGSLVEQYGRGLFLSKVEDDKAQGFITFLKGQQIGERFTTGLLGEGGVFRKDADGTTYLEADKLYIRMKAYFDTVEIREYIHSGGNRIASVAGVKCVRVEWIGSNGKALEQRDENLSSVVKFRCYFRGSDDEKEITNDFVIGDQAYCHITNVELHSSLYQHHYWRLVIGKSTETNDDGEHYIDLSNVLRNTIGGVAYAGYQNGSDIPVPQDDVIQLGNVNDNTRRGAIIEFVSGEDAPSYQIFQNLGKPVGTTIEEKQVSQYSLENKNFISIGYNSSTGHAYMNVYGDFRFGSATDNGSYIKYSQDNGELEVKARVTFMNTDQELDAFVQGHQRDDSYDDSWIQPALDGIQEQIDGELDTWYYEGVPTLNNAPANTWTTEQLKKEHVGDLYYDKATGFVYRFLYDDENESYYWTQIHDDAISEALRIANQAQDTADNKRRVFICDDNHHTPTLPYDEGDLWVNVKYPWATGATYNNEILKCINAKTSGQSFSIDDWSVANGYTAALKNFVDNTYAPFVTNIQGQVDGKAETWRQATNPANAWTTDADKAKHVGDIWMDISANGGKKTYIYVDKGSGANPRYDWEAQDVPDDVFDEIDGKADIFVSKPSTYNENDLWIIEEGATNLPTGCVAGDIVIADNMPSGVKKRTTYNKNDWRKKDRYTDDTKIDSLLANQYVTQLTQGTLSDAISTAQGTAEAANAAAAALGYLSQALGQDTQIVGGLVLSSLIGLRDGNGTLWSGLSGTYMSSETGTGYKGHGIAAWYGGGQIDHEVSPSATHYAKSIFRFDGSGYLAGGNITWDKDGRVAIKDITTLISGSNTNILNELTTFNNAFHFNTQQGTTTVLSIVPQAGFTSLDITENGTLKPVATQEWVGDHYISIAFFDELFQLYNDTIKISPNGTIPTDKTNLNIKAMFGFWTDAYISALGKGTGGGDITLNEPLLGINGAALGRPSTANVGIVWNGSAWVYRAIGTGSGTVTQVKVGNMAYNPSNGVVSLPAYPTTLPASDVQAWAKATTKPSYTLDEVTDGTTRRLIPYNIIGDYTTNSTNYTIFASVSSTSDSKYKDCIVLLSGGGYYYTSTNLTGQWLIEMRSDSAGTPVMKTICLIPPATSKTVSFGYYTDTEAGITYFAIKSTGRRGELGITTLLNNANLFTIYNSSTRKILTGEPEGWTSVAYNTASLDVPSWAMADAKPSYTWNEIGSKPTTISGYGITDAKIESGVITLGASTITPVTSVAMTVPTGFSISGSPISKTGTLALSYASGYEGFTTTLKNKIDLLYSLFTREGAGTTKNPYVIKANYGLYSDSFISALGAGSDSGGGGGQGDVTWDLLANNSDTRQIALSHLTTALNGYITSIPLATSSVRGGVKIGYSENGKNYAVKLSSEKMYVSVPWENTSYTFATGDSNGQIKVTPSGGNGQNVSVKGLAALAYKASLSASDIPDISADKITSGTLPIARGGTGATSAFEAIENLGGLSLASRGTNIPDNTDLNTYTTAGKYYCTNSTHASTMTNPPTTGSGFTLIVYVNYSTSRLIQKAFQSNHTTRFRYTNDGGTTWSEWKTFAYTDSDISGNAATATALATSRTIWGQSFDGTADVSGSITGATTIEAAGYIYLTNTSRYHRIYVNHGDNSRGIISYDSGNSTNLTTGYWRFYEFSPESTASPTSTGYAEIYSLPTPAKGLTENAAYNILTTKNLGFSITGNAGSATKLQTARTIWGQSFDGTANISGAITGATTISASSNVSVGGTLGVTGAATVGGDLTVNGGDLTVNEPNSSGAAAIWFQSGGTTYGNLRVKPSNGEFYFYNGTTSDGQSSVCVNAGWFYSYGQVTALSDARAKKVIGDVSLDIEQIANAPAIRFLWNDGRKDKSMQAGSIAQYWQKVLPEVIREKDDRLSLSYGVAALVSSIITARKVVDHEKMIKKLERENRELKNQINKLKVA